jgi:TonB family protein
MKRFVGFAAISALFVAASVLEVSASGDIYPKPIRSELPMYPEMARKARVAGTVKAWFLLDENGEVAQVEVISGPPLLKAAAVNIVKSWKFQLDSMIRPNARYETEFVYVLDIQWVEGSPKLRVSMLDFRRIEIVSELYSELIN